MADACFMPPLDIITPNIVLDAVQDILEGQEKAAAEVMSRWPLLKESVHVRNQELYRIITKRIRQYHTALYLDIENVVPPHFNEMAADGGVLVCVAAKSDTFSGMLKSTTAIGVMKLVQSGHLHTFPCGNCPEEADNRLQNIALELADMCKGHGMKHIFLSADRGFTITADAINVNDHTACALVLKPGNGVKLRYFSLRDFIVAAHKHAADYPLEERLHVPNRFIKDRKKQAASCGGRNHRSTSGSPSKYGPSPYPPRGPGHNNRSSVQFSSSKHRKH